MFNLTHILEMADNASKMVTEAIDAFVKSDIEVAKKVARQDDIVDELLTVQRMKRLNSFIRIRNSAQRLSMSL